MSIIDNLKWRYATKKFDTSKKLTTTQLDNLKQAVGLAASSYGLQPYKVFVIEDPIIKEKLKEVSWGQPQITDSSEIFIFANFTKLEAKVIDDYIKLKSEIQGVDISLLKGYGDFMKQSILALNEEQYAVWTSKQTYIALGTLLSAAAELKIDACPMEGFDKEKYNEILGFKEMGLSASVIATIGFRSSEDESQNYPKVRKPISQLFTTI